MDPLFELLDGQLTVRGAVSQQLHRLLTIGIRGSQLRQCL
jgi:hypothetical protein